MPDELDLATIDLGTTDLTPVPMECLRCRQTAPMRFAGVCESCRDALYERYSGDGREVDVAAYEPKMNVTPNAVALKDD